MFLRTVEVNQSAARAARRAPGSVRSGALLFDALSHHGVQSFFLVSASVADLSHVLPQALTSLFFSLNLSLPRHPTSQGPSYSRLSTARNGCGAFGKSIRGKAKLGAFGLTTPSGANDLRITDASGNGMNLDDSLAPTRSFRPLLIGPRSGASFSYEADVGFRPKADIMPSTPRAVGNHLRNWQLHHSDLFEPKLGKVRPCADRLVTTEQLRSASDPKRTSYATDLCPGVQTTRRSCHIARNARHSVQREPSTRPALTSRQTAAATALSSDTLIDPVLVRAP